MNDALYSQEPSGEPLPDGDHVSAEEIPQFGAVDIVEAFTAMRHEWRGQTKETRVLAEQIQEAVASLQSLEAKRAAATAAADKRTQPPPEARQLALLIVETDHQLSRAVAAIAQWEENWRLCDESAQQALERQIAAMNGMARWFSRPLLALLAGQHSARGPAEEPPAVAGLNMVLARMRRMMHEQGIERLDVQGQPFDAETMHAIGTVASTACLPGYVAEQLSPAYRWQGQLLRFADVRIADRKPQD
jgi:molecular chaperone GrpE